MDSVNNELSAPGGWSAAAADGGPESSTDVARSVRPVRSWPLLVLALPAAVAIWSGWIGIGKLTGFGIVQPLPGIWESLRVDTAVTLPIGVEAYAAMALHAWLTSSPAVSTRTRRFARWSAIGSLALGAAGQAAYHLMAEAHMTRAPWQVTTLVASLPVLVLGLGTALAHMLRADAAAVVPGPDQCAGGLVAVRPALDASDQARGAGPVEENADRGHVPDSAGYLPAEPMTETVRAAVCALLAAGRQVSRRSLRAAGVSGSNAELGELARRLRAESLAEDRPAA